MKKIIITFSILFLGLISFSQDEGTTGPVNKKGETILPQKGDIALGVDASPFVNLIGNMFRINDATGPFSDPSAFNFIDGFSLYGKYFLDEKTAVRARLYINSMSTKFNNLVVDDANASDLYARVTDSWKHSENGIGLGLGYEMRRGKSRLQAFYGGEVNLYVGGGYKDTYEYGNVLNNFDSIPTSTIDWDLFMSTGVDSRLLERKIAGGFGFGIRAFAGIEYFIFPKISVGGEFGLGVDMNKIGEGNVIIEHWNYSTHSRESVTTKIAGSSSFDLGNDNLGGNIFVLFHF
jgi:hypothetical protein